MIGRLEHGKILFSREYNEYNKDYSFLLQRLTFDRISSQSHSSGKSRVRSTHSVSYWAAPSIAGVARC